MPITGQGLGEVTVAMDQERSSQETSADGSIMVSKLAGNHGRLTLTVQQTSKAHTFLLAQYNAAIFAPPSFWAQGAGLLKCLSDNTSHRFTGISFQKLGDKAYGKQGAMVTWTLLCGDIQTDPF